jgi:uncharacterized protein YbjT (DUF2867 family)
MSKHSSRGYLITGATGTVGSRVVANLLARGERPRVFVRDGARARALLGDGVDVAVGDLGDAPSLVRAMTGMGAALVVATGEGIAAVDAMAANVAKAMGVRHVVKLSSMDVRRREGDSAFGAWHARGEAAIRESGLSYTFVQPAGFMSNALHWAHGIRSGGVVRASTGDGRVAVIHPDDIADVVTTALTTHAHDGESLAITGPEALSYASMTARLAEVIGRPLAFEPLTDAQAHAGLEARGMPAPEAAALVALWRGVREGHVETVTNEVRRVLGRAPRTFAAWAQENAAAFA